MRLTRIAVIALIGIVLFSTSACSSTSTSKPTATPTYTVAPTTTPTPTLMSGFTTYTNTSKGFSISVPDGWDTRTMQETEVGIFFVSPSRCAGGFPIASVATTNASGYTSVQTYYLEVFEPQSETWNGYKLISEENLTINGIPAIKVIYTSEGYNIQEMGCILLNQQTAWMIVGSCDIECWDTYESTFNTMINSFHMLD
jgi:hypothetical protein